MKKDYYYYLESYIKKLLYKHMYRNGKWVAIVTAIDDPSKNTDEVYPLSEAIMFANDEKKIKDFFEKNNTKYEDDFKNLQGCLRFDLNTLTYYDEWGSGIGEFTSISNNFMNKLKYSVLHECRHSQQLGFLLDATNDNRGLVYDMSYNDLHDEKYNENIFEVDAFLYAIQYIMPGSKPHTSISDFAIMAANKYLDE